MDKSNLPYRFREATFRQFEVSIAEVIHNFPGVSTFNPMNVETFSCRLRDSIRSLAENSWKTVKIDIPKFLSVWKDISVGIRGNHVIAGSKESIKTFDYAEVHDIRHQKGPVLVAIGTRDQLRALFLLHSERVFTEPHKFEVSPSVDPTLDQDNFDIVLEKDDSGIYTIL